MTARLGGSARFRFHGDLEDHLPPDRRGQVLVQPLGLPAGVKDLIEALGVPHPEVDLILANGEPVGFSYRVEDSDRIDVFPDALDATSTPRLRPRPVPPVRFVLDEHLGRLARYLRLLGFDAWWHPGTDDDELARRSAEDGRVLLTRDRGAPTCAPRRRAPGWRSPDRGSTTATTTGTRSTPPGASPVPASGKQVATWLVPGATRSIELGPYRGAGEHPERRGDPARSHPPRREPLHR